VLLYNYCDWEMAKLWPPKTTKAGPPRKEETMTGLAMTRAAIVGDTLSAVRTGALPAMIGALGAGVGLYFVPILFATASVPMSVLGFVLGLHSRTAAPMALGALGALCAVVALVHSNAFWLLFAALFGALTGG